MPGLAEEQTSDVELHSASPVGKIDLFITIGEDFHARDEDALPVSKGQVLRYLEQKGTWVLAADVHGRAGYVPAACCRIETSDSVLQWTGDFNADAIVAFQKAEAERLRGAIQKPSLCSKLSLRASLNHQIENLYIRPTGTDCQINGAQEQTRPGGTDHRQLQQQIKDNSACGPLKQLLRKQNRAPFSTLRETYRRATNKAMKVARRANTSKTSHVYSTGEGTQTSSQNQNKTEAGQQQHAPKLEARSPIVGRLGMPSVQEHANQKIQAAASSPDEPVQQPCPAPAPRSVSTFRRLSSLRAAAEKGRRRGYSVTFSESVCTSTDAHEYENIPGETSDAGPRYENLSRPGVNEPDCEHDGLQGRDGLTENDQEEAEEGVFEARLAPVKPFMQDKEDEANTTGTVRDAEELCRPTAPKPRLPAYLHHSAPTTRATSPDFCRRRPGVTERQRTRPRPIVGSLDYRQADGSDPLASSMSTFQQPCDSHVYQQPDSAVVRHHQAGKRRVGRVMSDAPNREFAQRSFSNQLDYRPTSHAPTAAAAAAAAATTRPNTLGINRKNGHSLVARSSSVPAVLQPLYIALFDFPATQKPLLNAHTGDVLQRCSSEIRDDNDVWCGYAKGWRYVRNPQTGAIGYVPKEILQTYRTDNIHGVSITQL
eukprot:scpid48295/ scgid34107/ 